MKNELRKIYKAKRSAMASAEVLEKSRCASKVFLESDIYKNADNLMLYIPLGNEVDTSLIIECALNDGKNVIVPVTDKDSGEITPCYINKDEKLVKGAFCVNEPLEKRIFDSLKIDVILIPGIAFDKRGARIGFGKGCYDRFLKNTSALKIGFCYDFQVCDVIPAEKHDITVNFLVTDKGITEIFGGII